jgi:hypothetical protein
MLWGDQSFRLILIFNKRQVAWLVRQNGLFVARGIAPANVEIGGAALLALSR